MNQYHPSFQSVFLKKEEEEEEEEQRMMINIVQIGVDVLIF